MCTRTIQIACFHYPSLPTQVTSREKPVPKPKPYSLGKIREFQSKNNVLSFVDNVQSKKNWRSFSTKNAVSSWKGPVIFPRGTRWQFKFKIGTHKTIGRKTNSLWLWMRFKWVVGEHGLERGKRFVILITDSLSKWQISSHTGSWFLVLLLPSTSGMFFPFDSLFWLFLSMKLQTYLITYYCNFSVRSPASLDVSLFKYCFINLIMM